MGTVMFRWTALLLSLAFAAAPTAADYCASQCETTHAAHSAGHSTAHGVHHHDHAAMAIFHIDQAPQPCGHDHNGIIAVAASDIRGDHTAVVHDAGPANILISPGAFASSASAPTPATYGSKSPPGITLSGFASPIRV
jgi:hypothetical protein